MVFGSVLRESSFNFGDDVVNLNHGSYGACPREVLDARIAGMMEELSFPDEFYRVTHGKITREARSIFASELNCSTEDVVCVPNATFAMNVAVRNMARMGCTTVKCFTTTYGSNLNLLRQLEAEKLIRLIVYDVDETTTLEVLIASVAKNESYGQQCVILDTVSSMPSFVFPWENILQHFQKNSRYAAHRFIIDGAHGMGLINIDLSASQPDVFITNAHKWFYAAHSCAAMYVKSEHQPNFPNLVVGPVRNPKSTGENWADNFESNGTTDMSGIYSIPAAANFREEVLGGGKAAMIYQNDLATMAKDYLMEAWSVSEVCLTGKQPKIAMFTIICPYTPIQRQKSAFTKFMQDRLREEHKTYVPFILFKGKIVMRFSAAIYLELNDFKFAKRVIEESIEFWKTHYADREWVN